MGETIKADVAVVGAGIAGAGFAASLNGARVALIEAESRPGHHATGRSAAILLRNYGNAAIRALTRASVPLFEGADPELFPHPLLSPRGLLYVADEAGKDAFDKLLAYDDGLEPITREEALARVPALRSERLAQAALERDAADIDVASLHQGFLKGAARKGATLLADAPVTHASREGNIWRIETKQGVVEAPVLVDAAGAWADRVAGLAGAKPLGLVPLRRSMAVLPPDPRFDIRSWPLIADAAEGWYAKPEAGRLLVSPAEEHPAEPHDAFADDMVLAEGLDRFERHMDWPVTRVERSWAGLRTFAPDRTPVVGFDAELPGFFWLAGQGGYGIQTAPALSLLAAKLCAGETPSREDAPLVASLSPVRFTQKAA